MCCRFGLVRYGLGFLSLASLQLLSHTGSPQDEVGKGWSTLVDKDYHEKMVLHEDALVA